MSLFGSKKKTYVSTVAYSLNGGIPINILPTVMLNKTLSGDYTNNGEYIKNSCIKGVAFNLRRYLSWAQKQNSDWIKTFGITETNFYPDVQLNTEVLNAYLSQDLSEHTSVEIKDNYMGFYDYWEIGEAYVINLYPQYIDDDYTIEEIQTKIGSHIESHEEFYDTESGSESYLVYETVDDYRTDTIITFSDETEVIIDSSQYNKDTTYIYCKYNIIVEHIETRTVIIDGRPTEITVITYDTTPKKLVYGRNLGDPGLGIPVVPELDQIMLDATSDAYKINKASYYPPIPIRFEKKFYSDENRPDIYKLINTAGYYCFGDYRTIPNIIEKVGDNSSINDINHTNIIFGVDITTMSHEGMQYLYEYFYNIWLNKALIEGEDVYATWVTHWTHNYKYLVQPYTVVIKTDQKVAGHYTKLRFQSIGHFYESGVIAEGAVPGDYGLRWHNHSEPTGEFEVFDSGYDGGSDEEVEIYESVNETWFCHQITSTTFEYVAVAELDFQEIIHGTDYTYNAFSVLAKAYKKRFNENVPTSPNYFSIFGNLVSDKGYISRKRNVLPDMSKEPDPSGFIVPLEANTLQELSLVDQTQLCAECMFIVFNCYKVVKRRWYQRWGFTALIVIIVIVVTILTWGTGTAAASSAGASATGATGAGAGAGVGAGAGGSLGGVTGGTVAGSTAGAVGSSITAGSIASQIFSAALRMLAAFAIATVANYLGKIIGGPLGMIVRIVGAIIAAYVGAGGGFSWESAQSIFTQPSFYLKCMNSTLQVGQQLQQERLQLLYQDMNEFNAYSARQEQRLRDAQYEFRYSSNLDIKYLDRQKRERSVFWVEGRNTYIERTIGLIHNFPSLIIDPVCNFCSMSLTLDDKSYLD